MFVEANRANQFDANRAQHANQSTLLRSLKCPERSWNIVHFFRKFLFAFLAVAFFAVGLFAVAFLAVTFLAPAFFAAAFLAVAFLAVVLFAVTFFAVAFFAVVLFAVTVFAVALFAEAFFAVAFFVVALFAFPGVFASSLSPLSENITDCRPPSIDDSVVFFLLQITA